MFDAGMADVNTFTSLFLVFRTVDVFLEVDPLLTRQVCLFSFPSKTCKGCNKAKASRLELNAKFACFFCVFLGGMEGSCVDSEVSKCSIICLTCAVMNMLLHSNVQTQKKAATLFYFLAFIEKHPTVHKSSSTRIFGSSLETTPLNPSSSFPPSVAKQPPRRQSSHTRAPSRSSLHFASRPIS